MWNFASSYIAGNFQLKKDHVKSCRDALDCSDDEGSYTANRGEGLECQICWESFNLVENVPYVLWCGHTLCKNCILGLKWTVVKFPTLPIQLPLLISCPWCNLMSPRLVYRGTLKFPRKNFFLLWMLESMNGDTECWSTWSSNAQPSTGTHFSHSNQTTQCAHQSEPSRTNRECTHTRNYFNIEGLHSSFRKSLVFFALLPVKFPLVLIFLMIILYAIPASAVILTLYMLITVLFALPSFLILYFAYPSLDWLVKEILT